MATEHALDAIEAADLNQLRLILAATLEAAEGITGALIRTVIALANENYETARLLAEQIAGKPSQREAFAIRLRALAPALDIAEIIAPASGQT